ncbi:hypothetical protein D3C71_1405550 [compost metagenome]
MLPAAEALQDACFAADQQAGNRRQRGAAVTGVILDHRGLTIEAGAVDVRFQEAFAALEQLGGGGVIDTRGNNCVHRGLCDPAVGAMRQAYRCCLLWGTKDFVNFSTRQYTNPDDVGEMS